MMDVQIEARKDTRSTTRTDTFSKKGEWSKERLHHGGQKRRCNLPLSLTWMPVGVCLEDNWLDHQQLDRVWVSYQLPGAIPRRKVGPRLWPLRIRT